MGETELVAEVSMQELLPYLALDGEKFSVLKLKYLWEK